MDSEYSVGSLIYDASVYDGMNTQLGDLEFYKKWMPKDKNANILELCCGTGRLTIPLVKEGHHITGLDFTPSMLEQAKKKAAQEGLQIPFVQGDMRTFVFQDKFDLVFIPFNSIHHLYTNQDIFRTFSSVKKHLKEDGLFIFDCFNPNIRYVVEAETEEKQIAEYTTEDGREIVIKQTMNYESATQINRIAWHYFINDSFDSTQNLDMRLFYPQELNSYLERMDFTISHKFGNFEEKPFDDSSEKQIFICQKATSLTRM
ncbi:MAG: class I SAM-dependent methyltransferase [Bacteroidota bacterium]